MGLKLVREAGETKMCEIRAHMAKIRQILDDKEKIALETVENEMKRRLTVLHSEVNVYATVVPDLGGNKFSKVLYIVTLHRESNRALTCEHVRQTFWIKRTRPSS